MRGFSEKDIEHIWISEKSTGRLSQSQEDLLDSPWLYTPTDGFL
jgi:hypothetical protein